MQHPNHSNAVSSTTGDGLLEQRSCLQTMAKNDSATRKPLLLSSFQIVLVLMKDIIPFREAEKVVESCLEFVTKLLQDVKQKVDE